MKNQDWKLKYSDLKLKFHDAVDVAFRLGYEAGAQGAQLQQAQQAAAVQPGQDPNAQPGQEMNSPASPDGSELDQHIGTLQGMLSQSKPGTPEQASLQKSLDGIRFFRSTLKQNSDLIKSEKAIKEISKNLKTPFTLSKAASKNMSQPAQKALSMQEQMVEDLMKSMAEEEKKATEIITKTLDFEQLLKG